MKIYFAGSIRGGRSYADLYKKIIVELENYGTVLTEHIGAKEVIELEMHKTDKQIFSQDMDWLKQADVLVADVSVPSLGVGYEIGYAANDGKNILCLYHLESEFPLSAMISGDEALDIIKYNSIDDIKNSLKQYFSKS